MGAAGRGITAEAGHRIYSSKRNFKTPREPAPPTDAAPDMGSFVVQKHAVHGAGRHWDLRLEHNGVLWSWVVPKGPSLDPAERRIAVHVEDHPVTYADFQAKFQPGNIAVVQSKPGTRAGSPDDPAGGMRKESIHFVVHGERLSGRFTLARLKQRDPCKQEAWFLIKGHHEYLRKGIGAPEIGQKIAKMKGRRRGAWPIRSKATHQPAEKPKSASIIKDGKLPTIVVPCPPRRDRTAVAGVELIHLDRQLWPGISKRDLAAYWFCVAPIALPDLVNRPLSIIRCRMASRASSSSSRTAATVGFPRKPMHKNL